MALEYRLSIAPKGHRKGRSFSVRLMHLVTANRAWDKAAGSDDLRPVYAAWAGSVAECNAFTANARSGRAIEAHTKHGHRECRVEFLKSGGYRYRTQRLAGDLAVVTAYLPALFELDPGFLPDRVRFVFAPPSWWVAEQAERLVALDVDERAEGAAAALFAAYLDRRTPLPLVTSPRFQLRLFRAAREEGWWHNAEGTKWKQGDLFVLPSTPVGLEWLALIDGEQEDVEALVERVTREYFEEEAPADGAADAWEVEAAPDEPVTVVPPLFMPATEETRDGATGSARGGGLLPDAGQPLRQLGLFGPVD